MTAYYPDTWNRYAARFRSRDARDHYEHALNDFLSFSGITDLFDATGPMADSYLKELQRKVGTKEISPATKYHTVNMMRGICDYAMAHRPDDLGPKRFAANPFFFARYEEDGRPFDIRELPSMEEIREFFEKTGRENRTAYICGRLAYFSGMDSGSIRNIRMHNVAMHGVYIDTSGGHLLVTLPASFARELFAMKAGAGTDRFLICNSRGGQMSRNSLSLLIRKYAGFSIQDLANFSRCQMFAAGMKPEEFLAYTGLTRHYEKYYETGKRMKPEMDFSHAMGKRK